MGGHADGNIASSTAVTTFKDLVSTNWAVSSTTNEERCTRLRTLIDEANQRIFQRNRGFFSLEGMGTTLVALMVGDQFAITACVGDSRIYRFRRGKLRQLTQDHSLLEELKRYNVGGGRTMHPLNISKNIITRALGMNATVQSDLEVFPHKQGDIYLLCSDGLTDLVDDVAIREILSRWQDDLATASAELVNLANENGGTDNITVVLARRREPEAAQSKG
jgi:protein phosphatase